MKKIMISLLLLSSFTFAFALNSDDVHRAGFSNLTTQQQADVLKQIATTVDQAKVMPIVTEENVEKVERWVNVGTNIGKGLAGAAKELGVAVNDFSQTGVGQWTMF